MFWRYYPDLWRWNPDVWNGSLVNIKKPRGCGAFRKTFAYTGDQARRGGSGLGLSIVRLLAEQMGGAALATLQGGLLEIRVELPLAARTGTAACD